MYKEDFENLYETYELSIKNLTNRNKELQKENKRLNEVANKRMKTILEIKDCFDEYLTSEYRFEGDSYDKGACRIIDEVLNIINKLRNE